MAALFFGTLSPSFFVFGADTVSHDYPVLRWAWDATTRSGELPLWCPTLACGIPTLGSTLFCPFYPTQWLFAVAPFPLAFTLQYFVAFLWGGVGAWLLARRWGIGRWGAVAAGLAFGLSAHFATLTYAGHMQKVLAIAWLPWALAGFTRLDLKGALLAGLALAMQLLASHPQIAYYTIACGVLLVVCSSAIRQRPLHTIALFLVSLVLAGALSSAQLLPVLEMNAESNRAGGVEFDEATKTSFPPWELIEIAAPRFSGDSIRGGRGVYLGGWGVERIVSDYAGAGWLVFVLVGLVAGGRRRWPWVALWVVACAMAVGSHTPLYGWAYRLVPGIASFRSPGTVMVVMALSTAMLAGLGIERLANGEYGRERHRHAAMLVIYGGLLIAFALTCVMAARGVQDTPSPSQLVAQSLRHSSFFAGGACLVLAVLSLLSSRWRVVALASLLAVCTVDLVIANRAFIQPEPADQMESYLTFTQPDAMLAGRTPPARVADVGNELSNRRLLQRVGTLHGYHPITFARYHEMMTSYDNGLYDAQLLNDFAVDYVIGPLPGDNWPPDGFGPSTAPPWQAGDKTLYRSTRAAPRLIHLPDGEGHVEWLSHHPNRLSLKAQLPHSGRVVIAESMAPGWQTTIDGEPADAGRWRGLFRSIELDAGAHVVDQEYRPFSFRLGLFLSLVAWSSLLAFLLATRAPGSDEGQKGEI